MHQKKGLKIKPYSDFVKLKSTKISMKYFSNIQYFVVKR